MVKIDKNRFSVNSKIIVLLNPPNLDIQYIVDYNDVISINSTNQIISELFYIIPQTGKTEYKKGNEIYDIIYN